MNMKQAAESVGVPYTTVANWVHAGLIRPKGYDVRRRVPVPWTEKEIRQLRNITALCHAGVSFQALRRAADTLSKFSSGTFVVTGDSKAKQNIIRVDTNKEIAKVLSRHPGQVCLCLFVPPAQK